MYCYHFTKYAGTDRIFTTDLELGQAGDLVQLGEGERVLLLGDDIAWKEQGSYKLQAVSSKPEISIPGLLGEKSLVLLYRFVNERYTTYKNSLGLWIPDVEDIVKRQAKSKKQKVKKDGKIERMNIEQGTLVVSDEEVAGQQLIVFPDLWSMKQMLPSPPAPLPQGTLSPDGIGIHLVPKGEGSYQLVGDSITVLHGKSTKKQKSEAFLGIKSGAIHTLICTYSQIFQDWHDLKHIVLVDQHKRYYKNQQDPRYYVPTVIEKMAEIWEAEVVKAGMQLKVCSE